MIVAGVYSFNNGKEIVASRFAAELSKVEQVIAAVDSSQHETKSSREKTMPGKILYSPSSVNKAFRREFEARGWHDHRVKYCYPTKYYTSGYSPHLSSRGAFRVMDFVKGQVGAEVQFGKYASKICSVCTKMTIFHNLDVIDVGIEIVPLKDFVAQMSSGVSYFEQFVWDLEQRGVADIDIPVLILGVTA